MDNNHTTNQSKVGYGRRNVLKVTSGLGIAALGLGSITSATASKSDNMDQVNITRNPKYLEVTGQKPSEYSPQAISFDGNVTPGTFDLHGTFIWDQDHEVEINVDWSPQYEDLLVGVYDRDEGEGGVAAVSGGYTQVTATVGWYSDDWAVFIGAPDDNTEAVTYSGNAQD